MTASCPTALTAWTRSVSGSVSLPSPGCFSPFPHGTVRYRSRPVGSLGPWSAQLPTRLLVSGGTRDACHANAHSRYRTVTCCGVPFQALPARSRSTLFIMHDEPQVSQPQPRNACTLEHVAGLGGSRFARHYSGTGFASSGYMRCFSSPTYLPRKGGSSRLSLNGVAPFGDDGLTA